MNIIFILISLCVILIAITIHEFSHALAADILGDPTPRFAGRLTLNPIKHLDPIGFLMLLLVRFGWAKPVPINPYNFKDPARGSMIVSFAGPASNLFAAWFVATLIKFLPNVISTNPIFGFTGEYFIFINLALAVFNLLPIPPLDGSHIVEPFLSEDIKRTLEQYGFFILIFILIFPPTELLLQQTIMFLFRLIT